MGLINPSRDVIDFNDFRALKPLYEAATEAGLWIVLRPGTYKDTWAILHLLTLERQGQFVIIPLTLMEAKNDCQYINAETTAGGIAHWITTEVAGPLRTNATDFRAAWQQYIQGIIKETAPYQITNGGPVIGTVQSE